MMMAHIVPMHCHDGVRFTGLDHPETMTTLCAPLHDGLQNRGEGQHLNIHMHYWFPAIWMD